MALVQFQLSDPHPAKRAAALASMARDGDASHLGPLRAPMDDADATLAAKKARLERLLTMRFGPDSAARVAAIDGFGADPGLDLRASLNPLLATTRVAAKDPPAGGANIAAELRPGAALTADKAFAILVAQGDAPAPLTLPEQREALTANIVDGRVGGIPVVALNPQNARNRPCTALEASGAVPVAATPDEASATIEGFRHSDVFT